jgi:excisionase family DNA binding protein
MCLHLHRGSRWCYVARMDAEKKIAVSVREAARLLSVSPRTIQNYVAAKMLPGRKIGRRTVIPVKALEAFIRRDQPSPKSSLIEEQRVG